MWRARLYLVVLFGLMLAHKVRVLDVGLGGLD